jgi:hypothetical protein
VLTAQWSLAVPVLAYRCVGSAGIAFLSRMLTGFPFHPGDALVCVPRTPETRRTLRACREVRKVPLARLLSGLAGSFPHEEMSGSTRKDRALPGDPKRQRPTWTFTG